MKKTLLMMTVMIFSVVASAKTNVYDFKVFAVGDDGAMNEDAVNRTIVRKLSGDDGDINKTSSENGVTKYGDPGYDKSEGDGRIYRISENSQKA